ncbi:MAG: prepilin-type N-terminal cleavage/methylation domain-containing protein [Pseudomonadota bacterium]
MRRQRGLGLFEFAVVLVIFGILATILLDRLVALEHETERLEVDLTLRHIHIGLKLAIGERIMRGEENRIPELLDADPLDFLDQQKVSVGGTAAGSWRYEPGRRILHYRPRQPEAFDGRDMLAWHFTGYRDELGRTVGLRLETLK